MKREKTKHKVTDRAMTAFKKITAIVLLCLLLAGCSSSGAAPSAKETLVKDAEEAAAVLAGRAEELGYANALSELTPVSTNVSGEHSFYRLQQNYNGIPVYGQQVVYVTDADGRCLAITQNIRDLADAPELTPTVSAEMVEGYLYTYIKYELDMDKIQDPLEFDLSQTELCIYDLSPRDQYDRQDEYAHLAYKIYWGSYLFLVDAHSGQVLSHTELVQNLSSPATLEPSGETFNAFQLSSGNYVMADVDEKIYILSAGGKTYWNSSRSSNNKNKNVLLSVISPDNVFGNANDYISDPEIAAEVLQTVRQIRKYYRDTLGEQNPRNLMVVYNDACGKLGENRGKNAGAGVETSAEYEFLFPDMDTSVDDTFLGMITLGTAYSKNASDHMDKIAHEYTHVVSRWVVDWSGNNEQTKILNEAFSDILGELITASITGKDPDWMMSKRNIKDPASAGFPVRTSDPVKGEVTHDRSTVISHAAYLMWNGMDGTESKKIPTEQLTQLWYKALLMMPSNADFTTCRTMVMEAGDLIGLTPDQMTCIKEAFNNAEIWDGNDGVHATVARTFKINVFDKTNAPLSRYEVTVEDVSGYYGSYLPSMETIVFKATDKEPCYLTLNAGLYRITMTPHKSEESFTYLVQVQGGGADQLDLYINYYSPNAFYCQVYTYNPTYMPIPNAKVSILSQETREPIAEMDTGPEGAEVTTEVFPGDYLLRVEAEGYKPYEEKLRVTPLRASQNQIWLYSVDTEPPTTAPTEPTEPYFDYPEIVTTQDDMDYGVYPFPRDFILQNVETRWDKMHSVYDTDTYGYDEGGGQDTITSSSPYYWWWGTFDASLDRQITDYIYLLSQEPFCLELIYTKDMGQEWVYVYRYTGKHQVYPLNISGFVPADAGEYHFAVDISKRPDYHGRIGLEIAAGYGLEPITPEILEDIRYEIGYNRTSNASENIEENETLDSGTCYFCYKTVYATAERPIYNEQIVYCDACYAEMFAG